MDPNTRIFIGTTGIDRDDNWCDECEDHLPFTTLKEFKGRMQEWWDSLDSNQMEKITGYRQNKRRGICKSLQYMVGQQELRRET
ncbi:hypothetical protein NIB75_19340 [Bacteroides uniformis]|nr:hypothetical protein [Bacteroides uniformis]MCO7113939.1 hypothetical protein [Bacteroides uniformis]